MRLTAKELEQMKSVDIGAVAPESLPDVSGMTFDTSLPREERAVLTGHADGLPAPAKKRAVTSVMARYYFETKCPEAEASLLSRPGRGII